jgi:ubiquitin-conjugating enzyme E2 Z
MSEPALPTFTTPTTISTITTMNTKITNEKSGDAPPVTISKDAVRRLLKDIQQIMKNPLHDQGIYYKHSETNMMEGWALIIGPKDSLYCNGYYFFKFTFPPDYPHSPPVLEYCTNDGTTRFHPNFYKTGKVCIDILNTWRGEKWSGCQTISSVLLTLISVMDNEPILNEPGITRTNKDFKNYHSLIEYRNLSFSIYQLVSSIENFKRIVPIMSQDFCEHFYTIMKTHFIQNKNAIMKRLEINRGKVFHTEYFYSSLYLFGFKVNYEELVPLFNNLNF